MELQPIYSYDPFVYETLQTIVGKFVVIETTQGSIEGTIKAVKPDHVVLKGRNKDFFIRIAQIVWIMPD
ncbi:YuzF family protein [Paenibacillus sp. MCAF9]|uniref:YuzF family protein n=1 Tax=unclassified Paenibacillus TaxID=185978 RepID=UPI003F9B7A25